MNDIPSSPAAGWYSNPEGEGLRWWNGSAWTEHTHTGTPAAEATTGPSTDPEPGTPVVSAAADESATASAAASAPPPGVVAPSGIGAAGGDAEATRDPEGAGLPGAGKTGTPIRVLGVRPWVWLALLLLAAAALLLPFVLFDDDDEIRPQDEPDREAPGKKSSGSIDGGASFTLLATANAAGGWVVVSS